METGAEFKDEAALIEHLRGVDAPCIGCGYSMRGLGGLTCPECGRRFRAGDLGRSPRAGWQRLFLGVGGWWVCVGLVLSTYVWEAAISDRAPMWYLKWFQGHNGTGLVSTTAAMMVVVWPVVRRFGRERAMAEPFLVLAWLAAGVHVAGLAIASL